MQRILNYIAGESVEPAGGGYLENFDPAVGRAYSELPDSDATDVERAVEAAARAFDDWSMTPSDERSRLLLDIAARIENDLERFARAESVDTGKPIDLARRVDIPRAVSNLRFFATAILHVSSEAHSTDHRALNYTLRRPRGVAGLISPWNLPLYLLTWKVAPALASGNTAVAKPSELTPMTAYMLSEVCRDAGLPPGVLNIVHGTGVRAGAAITAHPKVGTVSFTGGTATGAQIARVTSSMFKKVALEMGGKNPNIVFADADLEQAVPGSVQAAFANQGEICLCGSRILVERSIVDEFTERLVAATQRLIQGDPLETQTEQGALVSAAHRDKVLSYIDLALREGGKVLCGGGRPDGLPERARPRLPGQPGGDLRTRRHGAALRRGGRGRGPGQQHALRAGRVDLDPGPVARPPPGRAGRVGRDLDQLLDVAGSAGTVRRHEGQRRRSRRGPGSPPLLHRAQERLRTVPALVDGVRR